MISSHPSIIIRSELWAWKYGKIILNTYQMKSSDAVNCMRCQWFITLILSFQTNTQTNRQWLLQCPRILTSSIKLSIRREWWVLLLISVLFCFLLSFLRSGTCLKFLKTTLESRDFTLPTVLSDSPSLGWLLALEGSLLPMALGKFLILRMNTFVNYTFFSFAYPAYCSIQALETKTKGDDTQWLTYWVVFAAFSVIEYFADFIAGWVVSSKFKSRN